MRRILAATLLGVTFGAAIAFAQTKGAVPRAPDGRPDLTGVWQGGSTTPGSWDEANGGFGVGGTGRNPTATVIGSSNDRVPGREPAPYQEWAAKKVLESFNRRGIDDPTAQCLPAGVPRSVTTQLFPQQIIQTPARIVMIYEYMNVTRVVRINGTHPDDLLPTYMGDSVGRWDGNKLVVDVTGFNDKTWLAGAGTFHSEDVHVTERFTRVSKDRIDYEAVIVDPKVLTKPWKVTSSLMLREGTRLQEYICAENNLDPGRYEKLLKDGVKITR
jgi:hypothetical protein